MKIKFSDDYMLLTIDDATYEAKEDVRVCTGCAFNVAFSNCFLIANGQDPYCMSVSRPTRKPAIWIKKENEMKNVSKQHKHHDLIVKWASDPSQKVWGWTDDQWFEVPYPCWHNHVLYAVGTKPEKAPIKMLKYPNGTIEFPAPVKSLNKNQEYYYVVVRDLQIIITEDTFSGHLFDKCRLNNGLVHLTRETAELHAKAFDEFIKSNQPT